MKSAAYPTAQWKYSPSIVPAKETLLGPLADIHGDDVFALFEYFPNFLYWRMKEMPQSRCSQLALPRELLKAQRISLEGKRYMGTEREDTLVVTEPPGHCPWQWAC